MKQKKSRYILMLIVASILTSGVIAGISIYSTRKILREHSSEVLELQCQKTAMEFDSLLENIEQSVNTITSEALYSLDDFESFKSNPAYVEAYTDSLYGLMLYAARNTKGTMSVYIRYNPEFTGPVAGAFLTRNDELGDFVDTRITDLYAPGIEDISWYTVPVEAGHEVWIGPYHNYNVDYNMISYIKPYYLEGELIGIIGMDIDCDYIKEMIGDIQVYESGFAILLAADGQIVAHQDAELFSYVESQQTERLNEIMQDEDASGYYKLEDTQKTVAFATTKNNMLLGIIVPDEEIYASSRVLLQQITVAGIVAMAGFSLLTILIIRTLYHLAENDELTGIYNRKYFMTAFQEWPKNKKDEYTLFLFDVDFFKNINDNHGHNMGDFALKEVAKLTKQIIGKNNVVARWGGDEFIGIIPREHAGELLEQLRASVEELGKANNMPFTISIGYVDMEPGQELKDITERADKALYVSKGNGKNRITHYTL